VIAGPDGGHARADFLDDGAAFMTQYRGKDAFRVFAGERERVGVADAGRHVADQDFACLRTFEVQHFDFKWFACFPGDGSTCLHESIAPSSF